MAYTMFDITMNFEGDGQAIEWAKGFVFHEAVTREVDKLPLHSRFICLVEDVGVEVHYDFGADYYFFVDAADEK
ncbi:hypothetical protein [Vibrio barjaei]|uniref:hypothetical protein n=1 Tax=Vibrio barjaei TaxID=1676683 RepID=UPI002283511B|nr:hypothetical protein [Vibrio barjaei]MCY9874058.1 hypothetical protein [Vibrio barjaei]